VEGVLIRVSLHPTNELDAGNFGDLCPHVSIVITIVLHTYLHLMPDPDIEIERA
jgi:hypothetical protein